MARISFNKRKTSSSTQINPSYRHIHRRKIIIHPVSWFSRVYPDYWIGFVAYVLKSMFWMRQLNYIVKHVPKFNISSPSCLWQCLNMRYKSHPFSPLHTSIDWINCTANQPNCEQIYEIENCYLTESFNGALDSLGIELCRHLKKRTYVTLITWNWEHLWS